MSKKKKANTQKRITIKEISDAFYSGASVAKLSKMAQRLVEQENARLVVKCIKDK